MYFSKSYFFKSSKFTQSAFDRDQKAIIENKQAIELRNHNGVIDKEKAFGQINWIGKYLYYFDVSFDSSKNRINCHKKNNGP